MPKLTYRIANAPGKVYGKNSNELVFKEPTSDALIYSTATESQGLLKKSIKKQLFRGPPGEKEGGVCVATIDEPSATGKGVGGGSLEMHHHRQGKDEVASTKVTLKKASSWVPFSGNNNHGLSFRDAGYTWSGSTSPQLKRDGDGKVVARTVGPWFWEGKLGDMEVDVPEMGDEDERRDLLELALASFVLRWWGDKVVEEEKAKEAKKKQAEKKAEKQEQKAAAAAVKASQAEEKKKREEEESKKDQQGVEGMEAQDAGAAGL